MLEKKKIVWISMLPIRVKILSGELRQLGRLGQKGSLQVGNLRNRGNKDYSRNGMRRACMDNLSAKCLRKLIRIKCSNGYQEVI